MAWYKIDDKLHSHPKARRAGLAAMGLWSLAGSHCMDYLTDGVVEAWFVESWPEGRRLADKLVTVGLWDEHPDGWAFHDWSEYQPTREKVLAEREKTKQRVERFRNGGGNGVTNGVGTASPSPSPVPSPTTTKTSKSQSRSRRASGATDSYTSTVIEGVGNRAGIIDPPALAAAVQSWTGRNVHPDRLPTLVNHLVSKSRQNVKSAQAYVMSCLASSPLEVQQFIDENGLAS